MAPDEPRPPQPAKLPLPVTVRTAGRLGGFDLEITTTLEVGLVPALVAKLRRLGVEPPPRPADFERTPDGLPICPRHQQVMTKHSKNNDEWFSHEVAGKGGKALYCKGRPGPDSAGWDAEVRR